ASITGTSGGTFTASPAGLTLNAATGEITPATSTPGVYDVTYTTPGLCQQSSVVTVTISITPTVDPILDQTVCDGVNFADIIFTGSAGASFNWTNDNTNIGLGASGSGNILAFAGTAPTVQEVANITVTPVAGACTGTPETFTLTVNPQDVAAFNYAAAGWCTSDVVQTPNITGTGGGTFSSNPAGLSINATTGDIDPALSTPGSYTVTYTTSGVCPATANEFVDIYAVPTVDPVADQTVCVNSDFTAINFTGSVAGANYDWTNDNTTIGLAASGSGNIASFTGLTTGGTQVSNVVVTPSTANCVGASESFVLTVNDMDDPSFNYSPGLTYCQTAADPVVNITGMTGGTFSFTPTSGGPNLSLNASTGDVVLSTSDLGSYDITYNTAGAPTSLCPATQTLNLTITAAPVADFTFGQYCADEADPVPTFINGGSGGVFTSTPAGLVINPNTGAVDLGGSTPGTYTVTNDINIAGCPTATHNDDIIIFELPDATISGTTTICPGDPLPDVTIDITSGSPNWDITFNIDGVPSTLNAATSPLVISGAAIGTYDLVSIVDGNGCSTPLSGQVVIAEYTSPVVDPLSNQSVCEGDDLLIQTFTSTPPGSTFSWTNTSGNDLGFGLSGSGQIGSFTGGSTSGSPQQATIEVIPTSADGCVGPPETFVVTVNPLPVVSFNGFNLEGCEPLQAEFVNTTTLAGQSCVWDFGNGTTVNGCGTVYQTYGAGTYDVSLTVTTAEGCSASHTESAYVHVEAAPVAAFSFSPQELDVMDTEVQFTNNSINATSYEWDFGDGTGSFSENPNHDFPGEEPGEYVVTLTAYDDNNWCPAVTTQVINIDDVLIFYVPNVFTPDGDEFNEMFSPVFTSGFDPFDYHLTIFNRWGEVIFESFNAKKGWNGHYGDGGLVQDGVYVWQIEFKSNTTDKR
ncbi:MAG: gliding motility-associated C-terminal domain-containing protein, partial [Crocinitomicaceae bacterium]|nr:gliding motility-associated C-terminal domain-containing protein [Crocinitomicaceae bacterium]